jgi:hypothetical protein
MNIGCKNEELWKITSWQQKVKELLADHCELWLNCEGDVSGSAAELIIVKGTGAVKVGLICLGICVIHHDITIW